MGDFLIVRGQVLCLIAAVEACETTNGSCTYDLIDTGPGIRLHLRWLAQSET